MAKTDQDFRVWQGNNKKIQFELNQAINSDYHKIYWYLAKSTDSSVLLEKNNVDSTEVSLNQDENMITIYLMPGDTKDLKVNVSYYHELVIKNIDTDEIFTIATGRMKLNPTLNNNL